MARLRPRRYYVAVTEDSNPAPPDKLWAGRFRQRTSPIVDAYTSSLAVDRRIAIEDVRGSIAHARMLATQGIIPAGDGEEILAGLLQIREEIEQGRFQMDERLEDVHMNVEARLTQIVGAAAGRLHTARSRNDQVVTDLRLWLKEAIAESIASLHDLQIALVELAAENRRVVLPGYTHLQRAQPVLAGAPPAGLLRDVRARHRAHGRLLRALPTCCRWAAAPWPACRIHIDREMVARELEFGAISANSIDAVADRDFVVEYLSSLLHRDDAHLAPGRRHRPLVDAEFGFVELPDASRRAPASCRRRRTRTCWSWRAAAAARSYGTLIGLLTDAEGPAAGLQPRPPGGQGAAVRGA